MGTYNLPRSVKGEGRILFIFTPKSLMYAVVGLMIGLVFYFIFKIMNMGIVGFVMATMCSAIGYGIGMMKVPNIGFIKATKVVAGENLDDIMVRSMKFKKKRKIYIYDEEKTEENKKGGEINAK